VGVKQIKDVSDFLRRFEREHDIKEGSLLALDLYEDGNPLILSFKRLPEGKKERIWVMGLGPNPFVISPVKIIHDETGSLKAIVRYTDLAIGYQIMNRREQQKIESKAPLRVSVHLEERDDLGPLEVQSLNALVTALGTLGPRTAVQFTGGSVPSEVQDTIDEVNQIRDEKIFYGSKEPLPEGFETASELRLMTRDVFEAKFQNAETKPNVYYSVFEGFQSSNGRGPLYAFSGLANVWDELRSDKLVTDPSLRIRLVNLLKSATGLNISPQDILDGLTNPRNILILPPQLYPVSEVIRLYQLGARMAAQSL